MAGGDTSQKEETWDDFFRQREQNSCSPEPQVLDQLGGAEDATTLPFKKALCYGMCPIQDKLNLIICKDCGMVIKPVGYRHHMRLRHGVNVSPSSSASEESEDESQQFPFSPPHLPLLASTSAESYQQPPYYVEKCKDLKMVLTRSPRKTTEDYHSNIPSNYPSTHHYDTRSKRMSVDSEESHLCNQDRTMMFIAKQDMSRGSTPRTFNDDTSSHKSWEDERVTFWRRVEIIVSKPPKLMTFEEGVKSRKTEALRHSRMKMKRYSRRTKPTIKRVGNTREPSIFELEESDLKDIEKIEITPDREVETPEMAIAKLLQVPGLSFELQTGNGSVPIPLANIRKSSFDGVISRMVLNTSTGSSKDFLRKGSYTEMNESSQSTVETSVFDDKASLLESADKSLAIIQQHFSTIQSPAKNHNSEKISFQRVTDTNSLDISNKPLSKPTIKSVEESMGYSEISMNLPKHKTEFDGPPVLTRNGLLHQNISISRLSQSSNNSAYNEREPNKQDCHPTVVTRTTNSMSIPSPQFNFNSIKRPHPITHKQKLNETVPVFSPNLISKRFKSQVPFGLKCLPSLAYPTSPYSPTPTDVSPRKDRKFGILDNCRTTKQRGNTSNADSNLNGFPPTKVEQHETQPNLASTSSKVHIYPNIIRHNYEEKLLMANEEGVSSNQQESSRIGNDKGVFRRLVKTHNGGVMLIHPVSTSNVIIFPQNTSAAYQTVNFGNHFQTTAHSNFQQEYCLIEDDGTECDTIIETPPTLDVESHQQSPMEAETFQDIDDQLNPTDPSHIQPVVALPQSVSSDSSTFSGKMYIRPSPPIYQRHQGATSHLQY